MDHIVPLDFEHATHLPESHTWDQSIPVVMNQEPVSVIDLNDPYAVSLIRDACEKWGVFQIVNFGVPISLFEQAEEQMRKFFELPFQQKLLTVRTPEVLTGYGVIPIAKHFQKSMWSEGFSMVGSPAHHASKVWPNNYYEFCDVMENYQSAMRSVSEKVTELILKSLDLTLEDLDWIKPKDGSASNPQTLLQLNSYPKCPDPENTVGLTPHTDSSLVTLLFQGDISGLQIHRENVGWQPVEPVHGALVVNAGDLMKVLSNGRYNSAWHRAMASKIGHRISIVYFYMPPKGVAISPSPKLIGSDERPVYRPITWEDYRVLKSEHNDKAFDFIRSEV